MKKRMLAMLLSLCMLLSLLPATVLAAGGESTATLTATLTNFTPYGETTVRDVPIGTSEENIPWSCEIESTIVIKPTGIPLGSGANAPTLTVQFAKGMVPVDYKQDNGTYAESMNRTDNADGSCTVTYTLRADTAPTITLSAKPNGYLFNRDPAGMELKNGITITLTDGNGATKSLTQNLLVNADVKTSPVQQSSSSTASIGRSFAIYNTRFSMYYNQTSDNPATVKKIDYWFYVTKGVKVESVTPYSPTINIKYTLEQVTGSNTDSYDYYHACAVFPGDRRQYPHMTTCPAINYNVTIPDDGTFQAGATAKLTTTKCEVVFAGATGDYTRSADHILVHTINIAAADASAIMVSGVMRTTPDWSWVGNASHDYTDYKAAVAQFQVSNGSGKDLTDLVYEIEFDIENTGAVAVRDVEIPCSTEAHGGNYPTSITVTTTTNNTYTLTGEGLKNALTAFGEKGYMLKADNYFSSDESGNVAKVVARGLTLKNDYAAIGIEVNNGAAVGFGYIVPHEARDKSVMVKTRARIYSDNSGSTGWQEVTYHIKRAEDITSGNITNSGGYGTSLKFSPEGNSVSGTTVKMSGSLTAHNYGTTNLVAPVIYLAQPAGMTIDWKTLSLTRRDKTAPRYIYTDVTASTTTLPKGWTLYRIDFQEPVLLGYYDEDYERALINFSVDYKTTTATPSGTYNAQSLLFLGSDYISLGGGYPTSNAYGASKWNVVSGGSVTFTLSKPTYMTVQNSIRISGEDTWYSYDGTADTMAVIKPGDTVEVKIDIGNYTGQDVTNAAIYVPVPKAKEDLGDIFMSDASGHSLYYVDSELPAGWKVEYGTVSGSYNQMNQAPVLGTSTNMEANILKLYNTSTFSNNAEATITLKFTAETGSEHTNTENLYQDWYYYQVGENTSYRTGSKMCTLLQNGKLTGTVFEDTNNNGVQDAGETTCVAGITVTATEQLEGGAAGRSYSAVTDTNGRYSINGLPSDNALSVTFTNKTNPNPNADNAMRFSASETVQPAADNWTATTVSNVTLSVDGTATVNVGVIYPYTVTFTDGTADQSKASISPASIRRFQGETIGAYNTKVVVAPMAGQQFAGEWQIEGTETTVTQTDLQTTAVNGDVTYVAVMKTSTSLVKVYAWDTTLNKLTMKYSKSVPYGETVPDDFPGNDVYLRPGYDFVGWYINGDEKNVTYRNVILSTPVYADTNYFALYTPKTTINLTLNANGGTLADGKKTQHLTNLTYTQMVEYTVPSRDGYTFLGWSEDKDAETANLTLPVPEVSGKTYYAIWKANEVNVTYLANGGSWTGSGNPSGSQPVGTEVALPARDALTREGYTLTGWTVQGGDDTVYTGNYTIPAGGVTLVAQWTPAVYSITFKPGTGEAGTETTLYAQHGTTLAQLYLDDFCTTPASIPAFTREGYALTSWYVGEEDADDTIAAAALSSQSVTGNAVYTAKWEAGMYAIEFQANQGGYSDGTNAKTYYGKVSDAMLVGDVPQPVREGYTFLGWADTNTATTPNVSGSIPFTAAAQTYYAVWKVSTYTVRFHGNGGTVDAAQAEQTVNHGASITNLTDPTMGDVSFSKWYCVSSKTEYTTDQVKALRITQDEDFVALWEGVTNYRVTFRAYDGQDTTYCTVLTASGQKPISPAVTAPANKVFAYWTDESGNQYGADALPAITADVTFTANFTESSLTLYFTATDGTLAFTSKPVEANTKLTADLFPAFTTQPAANFKGWMYNSAVKTAAEWAAENLTITGNMTFAAVYEGSIAAAFDANGGTVTGSSLITAPAGSQQTVPTAARTGYTFNGWFTGKTSGTKLTVTDGKFTMPDVNTTYYAQWTAQPLTVTVTGSATYNGNAQTPAITVKLNGAELTSGDYVAVYSNNVNAGTNTASVTVYGLGDYAGLTGTATFSIAKAAQTVTFLTPTAVTKTYGDAPFANPASSTSGGTITYQSSNEAAATVDNNGNVTIHSVASGPVNITATAAATGNYEAASNTYTLIINKAAPALRFANSTVSVKTTGTVTNALTTEPAGLPVTYSSSNTDVATVDSDTGAVTLKSAGETVITALFAENANYSAANAAYTLTVSNDVIPYTVTDYEGVYDGAAHGATVTSTLTGAVITNETTKTDVGVYTVSFTIEAADYDTVTGTAKIIIKPAALTDATVRGGTYNGSAVEGTVSNVKADALTVPADGYTVRYANNINAGTATAIITGTGNYTGTLVKNFTITPKALTDGMVSAIADQPYTDSAVTPGVTVLDGETALVEGKDYTVSYSDNTNVGTATATVTGTGNYTGTVSKTFRITNEVTLRAVVDNTVLTYDGTAQTAKVLVYDSNDKLLTADTDYTLSNNTQTNAGTYDITVTGKGNYAGKSATAQFTINKAEKAVSFAAPTVTKTYGDDSFTNTLTLTPNDSAVITYASSNPTVATVDSNGQVTVVGAGSTIIAAIADATGNYNSANGAYVLTVGPKSISGVSVDTVSDQPYTGSPIMPKLTVKDGEKTLVEGMDYTVSYSDNTAVGTAGVTITGKGNYTGTTGTTFQIVANTNDFVVAAIGNVTYNGTAHTPEPKVEYADVTLTKDQDYTLSYSNNTNAGVATVTVTGKPGTAYAGLESTVNFTIDPADIAEQTVNAIDDQIYTGAEITPAVTITGLTEGTDFTVAYSDNTEAGTAMVVITGRGNYTGTTSTTFKIVAKKDASGFEITAIPDQTYTGSAIEPKLVIRDSGKLNGTVLEESVDYTVTYSENINVGTATASVKYIGNYEGTAEKTFNIIPKVTTLSVTTAPTSGTYPLSEQPMITVQDGSTGLDAGTDYTLSYAYYDEENSGEATCVSTISNAGVYVITAVGAGNYAGSLGSTVFVLAPASSENGLTIEGLTADDLQFTYDGTDHAPALKEKMTVKCGEAALTSDDYTLAFAVNNGVSSAWSGTGMTNVGVYVVTVQAKSGNYSGSATLVVVVTPKDIGSSSVSVTVTPTIYNGGLQVPAITVTDNATGKTLAEDADYVLTNEGGTDAGSYPVVIQGVGNYTGVRTETFRIDKKTVTIDEAEPKLTKVYGEANPDVSAYIAAAISADVLEADQEQVTILLNMDEQPDVGNNLYRAVLSGDKSGNYTVVCRLTLTVTAKDISDATVTANLRSSSAYYTGKDITPVVIVTDSQTGKTLTEGKDYTVTYVDAKANPVDSLVDIGSYKIVVTGKGNYTGAVSLNFNIVQRPAASSDETETAPCDGGISCPSRRFTDVNTKLWYHEAIDFVLVNGLMNGVSSTSFQPNGFTTRGMIVTILYRLEGSPAASTSSFADVAENQYYAKAVAWANANGIVMGYSSTTFGPNDPITREQMAAILYRYAAYKGYDVLAREKLTRFSDNDAISDYAIDAMSWAYAKGLVAGEGNNILNPRGYATRAEIATILMRFCENIAQ